MEQSDTALLVLDLQLNFISNIKKDSDILLKNTAGAIEKARAAKIPIIYVIAKFRDGLVDINPKNKLFSKLLGSGDTFTEAGKLCEVHPSIAPLPGDVIVIKKRVSPFTGTDLEVILKSLGVSHLVLAGISTSGVVLSTVRDAGDRDYQLTVLSDCVADNRDEVSKVLLEILFPMQADVITSDNWLSKNETQTQ